LSPPGNAGPLIRIIGDRWVWQVKAAILVTLGGLIAKAGLALKPFVPQLQTSFLKCLHDEVLPFWCLSLGFAAPATIRDHDFCCDDHTLSC